MISQAAKCDVLAVSTDSEFSHYNWTKTPRSLGGVGKVKIPLLSDKGGNIARSFGCLNLSQGNYQPESRTIFSEKFVFRGGLQRSLHH